VVTVVIGNRKQGFAPEISTASPVTEARHPGVTVVTAPDRPVLRVPKAVALDIRVPKYQEPAAPVVTPLRSYSPDGDQPKGRGGVRPMREKFAVADELAVAHMHLAVVKAFDIERRMDASAPNRGANCWPFPTLFDRNTDYAPGSVVLRPSPAKAAEVTFRDDVIDLLVELAKADVLGAKLVTGRALRKEWEELVLLDIQRRKRWTLDKVRRRALLQMVTWDRERALRIVTRVLEIEDHKT
jgi:hypothetical protein